MFFKPQCKSGANQGRFPWVSGTRIFFLILLKVKRSVCRYLLIARSTPYFFGFMDEAGGTHPPSSTGPVLRVFATSSSEPVP